MAPSESAAPTGLHVEATGSEARERAILHVVLGVAIAATGIAMLVMA